jgi:transposase
VRKELITLTRQEHERYAIIKRVMKGEMKQAEAADLLDLTDRQVRNLRDKVREKGVRGMAHGNRGKSSPRKMAVELVERIRQVLRERYEDFKPKLASEKLWTNERIRVSDEKLRQIMIEHGLWKARRKRGAIHVWRERKARCGELVQMDGSHHAWLEERGPRLVLMALIDDATGRAWGRFYAYEGVSGRRWMSWRGISGYTAGPRACIWTVTARTRRPGKRIWTSCCGARRPRPSSRARPRSWGSGSFMPIRRRPRAGWSGYLERCRTG